MRDVMREAPTHSFNAHLARAILWARWLLNYAENWVTDTTLGQEEAEREMRAEASSNDESRQRGTMTHERWRLGNKVSCRRCGREEVMGGEGRRALDDACAGSAAGRALAHASANPNHIWQDYRFTEADYISKGGILLQASRVPVCMLAEPQTAQEEWRERQSGAAGQTQGRSGVMPRELDP